MPEIRIRASSLPTWESCPRLFAGRHARQIGIAARYDLRPLKQHVGAAAGSATHRGAEFLMKEFAASGTVGGDERLRAAREAALDDLPVDLTYDSVTPGPAAAEQSISKLVTMYHAHIDPDLEPLIVEKGMTMLVGDDLIVSGHVDLVLVDLVPTDLKTGRHTPRAGAQYGGYFLLLRANAERLGFGQSKLKPRFRQTYLPRVPVTKPQPVPQVDEFPQGVLERQALATAHEIRSTVTRYRATGDINVFPARPSSWLCSPHFCPLWGSTDGSCEAWRLSAAARKAS